MRRLISYLSIISLAIAAAGCRGDLGNLFDIY